VARLVTTLGNLGMPTGGCILPHEHVFVDLRTPDQPGHGQAEASDVIALMGPYLEKARDAGVEVLVECTPVGVGRRVDILKAVSQYTGFPLVVPTGVYREPWIPRWASEMEEDELVDWMMGELEYQIEETGVKAGWVKLSAGDDGLTETESRVLRAASRAAQSSGAIIGSHTIRGQVVYDQLDIIEESGYSPERFIWIHAQIEPDFNLNLEIAWHGAWIEFDSIGNPEYTDIILDRILRMLDAGLGDQILLSHDRGWYDPSQPGGRPEWWSQGEGDGQLFTYLSEEFLPRLRAEGVDEKTIQQLTLENPFRAFARRADTCL